MTILMQVFVFISQSKICKDLDTQIHLDMIISYMPLLDCFIFNKLALKLNEMTHEVRVRDHEKNLFLEIAMHTIRNQK